MHFTHLPFLACFAALVAAQKSTANPPKVPPGFMITAGQPTTFQWTPTTQGSITLTLRDGAASDLNPGTVIASSIPNSGSYTFTLPTDTTRNSDYTIEIASDGDPTETNFTPPFVVESSNTVESVTLSTASHSASATSSASAASSSASASASTLISSVASHVSAASSKSKSASASGSSSTSGSSTATSTSGATATSGSGTDTTSVPKSGASAKAGLSVQIGLVAALLGVVAVWQG